MENKENRDKLQKLMAENPDAELRFFAWGDCEYDHVELDISSIEIEYIALYNDEQWLDEDDYSEKLYENMYDDYENEEQLKIAVDKELKKIEFKKSICVRLVI